MHYLVKLGENVTDLLKPTYPRKCGGDADATPSIKNIRQLSGNLWGPRVGHVFNKTGQDMEENQPHAARRQL